MSTLTDQLQDGAVLALYGLTDLPPALRHRVAEALIMAERGETAPVPAPVHYTPPAPARRSFTPCSPRHSKCSPAHAAMVEEYRLHRQAISEQAETEAMGYPTETAEFYRDSTRAVTFPEYVRQTRRR